MNWPYDASVMHLMFGYSIKSWFSFESNAEKKELFVELFSKTTLFTYQVYLWICGYPPVCLQRCLPREKMRCWRRSSSRVYPLESLCNRKLCSATSFIIIPSSSSSSSPPICEKNLADHLNFYAPRRRIFGVREAISLVEWDEQPASQQQVRVPREVKVCNKCFRVAIKGNINMSRSKLQGERRQSTALAFHRRGVASFWGL